MRNIARFALFISVAGIGCFACFAQSPSTAAVMQQQGEQSASAADAGITPLTYPYSISTEPHFAVFVEFPKADSIRRIALGDSNYFLAEADKTDPHYAIIKQIEAPTPKAKLPVETNMLVYMASGRVVDITLKAGKLEGTAYSIDYAVPIAEPKDPQPKKDDPPPVINSNLKPVGVALDVEHNSIVAHDAGVRVAPGHIRGRLPIRALNLVKPRVQRRFD